MRSCRKSCAPTAALVQRKTKHYTRLCIGGFGVHQFVGNKGDIPFLYAYHGDPNIVVSDEEAREFIGRLNDGRI